MHITRFLLLSALIWPLLHSRVSALQQQLQQQHNSQMPYVFEFLRTRYRFENDGTGTKEIKAQVRILTQAGAQEFPELTFQYKPSRERLQAHYVHILKQDGNRIDVETNPPANPRRIFREGTSSGFDFYERTLPLPPVTPGDALEYEVEIVSYAAETPGNFSEVYNFSTQGVIDEQLEIDVPIDRAVNLKANAGLQSSVKAQNDRRLYFWRRLRQPADFERERQDASSPLQVPEVQISSFRSWEEVGRWYAEMESSRRVPSPEVKARAEELTAGLKSDSEKAAVLYDFVSRKIKYLSFVAFGIGGYEPHTADEVLRLGFGDCKDKDILLLALLEAEGMHASSALINPIRKLDVDIPSPWPFTHVMTVLHLKNDQIWMDSSSSEPFRILPADLYKRRVLVIPSAGTPHFEETPD